MPSALSKGYNTYSLLSKLTMHVNHISNFSQLPIPFFCIATNIETGKQVVLDNGNLAQSIMASAALPTIFQPVVIHDTVLIDGGVVNNYPIDEIREKGIDFVIGVDVQDVLAMREELTSAPEVLMQINNFRTIENMKTKVDKTDLYIKPNIKDYSVISFYQGNKIIKEGKDATISKIEKFQKFQSKNHKTKNTLKPQNIDSLTIKSVIVKGIEKHTRAYIIGKLKLKNEEKISYDTFSKGINNLLATNNFDAVEYQLKKTLDNKTYDLHLTLKESQVNTFLKFGAHYDDLYKSAALINLTKKNALLKNDVASLDFILGDNVRYNFEYLIDKGFYWSIGLRSIYNTFNKSVNAHLLLSDTEINTIGVNKIDAKLQDQTNAFYLQTLLRKDFALSVGLEHKHLQIKSSTIPTSNPDEDFIFEDTDYISLFGNIKLDTYDNKYFPTKGLYFNGDLHTYIYASNFKQDFQNFSIAKADVGYAFSTSNQLAFHFQANGGFKIGDNSTRTLDFALGGYGNNLINNFVPFLGYDFISLTGNSYVKASALADYRIYKNHHFTVEANWANIGNNIFETGEWFSLPDYRGYALGYAINTFIGPVQVTYSFSPEQRRSFWFFNLGFWF